MQLHKIGSKSASDFANMNVSLFVKLLELGLTETKIRIVIHYRFQTLLLPRSVVSFEKFLNVLKVVK